MSKLFESLRVGEADLQHRIVMAPLTRYRADDDNVLLPFAKEYYSQRASYPGTLIITEATLISERAIGRRNVPGIYNDKQIEAWKEVTNEVHSKGCYIFCQLWDLGRAGHPEILKSFGLPMKSSSPTPLDETAEIPEELTEEEIHGKIEQYVFAARNAVKAGFDGVEIHGANGYLVDQFTQDVCNQRGDRWGGNVKNRARFAVEVTRAVASAIGSNRTAIRLSPFSEFLSMRMANPIPQFSYLTEQLKELKLAYLHVVEGRIKGNTDVESQDSIDFLVKIWDNASPVLIAGGFTAESAKEAVDKKYRGYEVAIVFGRYFISNPDLPFRIKQGISLTPYDRSLFYSPGLREGYIDYAFSREYVAEA